MKKAIVKTTNTVECPNCLGVGEEVYRIKGKVLPTECFLCDGLGRVNSEISDDFISSLNDELDY